MARRALAPLGVPVILMKGTAFHAAGFDASIGRSVGDLDIMVPRAQPRRRSRPRLLEAGWERMKDADGYDDVYYRRWMHELPPLIHRSRDRMIDVHHTILPLTARPTPDAEALIAASVALDNGLRILSPADIIVHAAAHLFADGDLAGGLATSGTSTGCCANSPLPPDFWRTLAERARLHQLERAVARALRLSAPPLRHAGGSGVAGRLSLADRLFEARLLARNGWGQERRKLLRFAFYSARHWLRMPPLMLARHLWVKARARLEGRRPFEQGSGLSRRSRFRPSSSRSTKMRPLRPIAVPCAAASAVRPCREANSHCAAEALRLPVTGSSTIAPRWLLKKTRISNAISRLPDGADHADIDPAAMRSRPDRAPARPRPIRA